MKKLLFLFLAITVACSSGDDSSDSNDQNNDQNDNDIVLPCQDGNPVYLDSNGVTIKACEWASIGDSGTINGRTYTIVGGVAGLVNNGTDEITRVCTSRITDMREVFEYQDLSDDIWSWIETWDVSKVTDMSYMFNNSNFNGDISNWDVSSVVNMRMMFSHSNFNKNISTWDVSNVTDMESMFWLTPFDQPIGNWDVSNMIYMGGMFSNTPFNQDISNWDVSSVVNMQSMFWGADSFNQDLGNWNVGSVLQCIGFSEFTPQWTLPKPNFTNCTP